MTPSQVIGWALALLVVIVVLVVLLRLLDDEAALDLVNLTGLWKGRSE